MQAFAPDVPLLNPITQQEQLSRTLSQERLIANLSLFFGLLAMLLVATGLYGTLAYKVARRRSEIGIRMALGAQRPEVVWMVLRESLGLCAFGVLAGLPAAIAWTRLLQSMLFGLRPDDPLTFAGAIVEIAACRLRSRSPRLGSRPDGGAPQRVARGRCPSRRSPVVHS
jgi:ABC-type antimicrobial peptide transport system permease subunit